MCVIFTHLRRILASARQAALHYIAVEYPLQAAKLISMMNTKSKILILSMAIFMLNGCSSMKSRSVYHDGGAYPGVRNLGQNYGEAEWGAARVPAMILDLPFSAVLDTLALPLDSLK